MTLFGILLSTAFVRTPTARIGRGLSYTPDTARAATLSPPIAEMLYAVNAGDRVAALGAYCNYPAETAAVPRIGGYLAPNFEKIHVLRPDVILVQGRNPRMAAFCRQRAIRCVQLDLNNLDAIYRAIMLVGDAVGRDAEAMGLVGSIRSDLDAITLSTPDQDRPGVFVCVNRIAGETSRLTTVNSQEFLGELITIAGGRNIFAELPRNYPIVNTEAVRRHMPDIIIELCPEADLSGEQRRRRIADWRFLAGTPAVDAQRIFIVTDAFALTPGPRVAQTAHRFAALIRCSISERL